MRPLDNPLEREVAELRATVERLEDARLHRRLLRLVRDRRSRMAVLVAALGGPFAAWAVTIPHTFVNGTLADANEVNANFNTLADALNLHEAFAAAHHVKTIDASEISTGTLDDARLSVLVSLLGTGVGEAELEFDPATQAELDSHALGAAAHHTRYADGEAVAAVGPHVTSIEGLSGGSIAGGLGVLGALNVAGEIESSTGGFRFPDGTIQTSTAQPPTPIARRLVVAPVGGDFTTIQAAIEATRITDPNEFSADDGSAMPQHWVIEIGPGTYVEDLFFEESRMISMTQTTESTLPFSLHLRGSGAGRTLLQPAPSNPPNPHISNADDPGFQLGLRFSHLSLIDPQLGPANAAIDVEDVALTLVDVHIASTIEVEGGVLELREARLEGSTTPQVLAIASSEVSVRDSSILDGPTQAVNTSFQLIDSTLDVWNSRIAPDGLAIDAMNSQVKVAASHLTTDGGGAVVNQVGGTLAIRGSRISQTVESITAAGAEVILVGNSLGGVLVDTPSVPPQILANHLVSPDDGVDASGAIVIGNSIEASGAYGVKRAELVTGNRISGGSIAGLSGFDSAIGNRVLVTGTATPIELVGNVVSTANEVLVDGVATDVVWRTEEGIEIESAAEGLTFRAGSPSSSVTLAANGKITIAAGDSLDLVVPGAFTVTAGSVAIDAAGAMSLNTALGLALSGNGVNIDSSNAMNLDAVGAFKAKGGASAGLESSGEVDLTGGTVDVNGALIQLN